MPFSCRSGKDVIYAEDFSSFEWENLKLRILNGTMNLELPYCNAKPSLRSGRYRSRHFAHLPGKCCKSDAWGNCSGTKKGQKGVKSESFDHIRIKEIIKEIAEKVGWRAQIEYKGQTPSADSWIADIFAEKGEFKIVFEIQISPQQFSSYRIRQQRYRESGIKCIWLSCVTPELSDEEIPVFELSKSNGVFVVDFPVFFIPGILKLPSDFTGVSLGEFIQLMLERCILWEQGWVSKFDQLASLEDWQRFPKLLTQNNADFEVDNPEHSAGYTAVWGKTSAKETNLRPKNTGNRAVTSIFRIRPPKYDHKAHCFKLIFFDSNGIPLIDYPRFRGDIRACKRVIEQEITKYPSWLICRSVRHDVKCNCL